MGASSSSSVNEVNQTNIVNKSQINAFNESINSLTANTIVNSAANCGSSLVDSQFANFQDITTEGDFDVSVFQKQHALLSFNCIQDTNIRSEIGSEMMNAYLNSIKTNFSSEALAEMSAAAAASAKEGSIVPPWQSSDSNANADMQNVYNSYNDIEDNIKNVVMNSIQNNVKAESVQSCMGSVTTAQHASFATVKVGGTAHILVDQEQGAAVFTECMQKTDVGNSTTNSILTKTETKVVDDSINTNVNKQSGNTLTEAIDEGVLNGIADIMSVFTDFFAKMGTTGMIVSVCLCLLCLCACIFFIYYSFFSEHSSSDIPNVLSKKLSSARHSTRQSPTKHISTKHSSTKHSSTKHSSTKQSTRQSPTRQSSRQSTKQSNTHTPTRQSSRQSTTRQPPTRQSSRYLSTKQPIQYDENQNDQDDQNDQDGGFLKLMGMFFANKYKQNTNM
jgi:hypothetical protein